MHGAVGGGGRPEASAVQRSLQSLSAPCNSDQAPARTLLGNSVGQRRRDVCFSRLKAPPPPHLCGVRKVLNSGIKDARSHTHEVTPGSRLKGIVPDVFFGFFLMHAVDPEMGLNLFSHSTVEFGHILVLAYRKLISYSS